MKCGVAGGIAVCLLCITSWSGQVAGTSVYVNDALLALSHPVLAEGGSVLVPVEAFGRTVGIDTTADDGRLVLHWSEGRRALDLDRCAVRGGIAYAAVEWLVGLVGGAIHRVGDAYYVQTVPATLKELEATAERIVLRFDGFVPIEQAVDGIELRLTIHHCRSEVEPQLILLGGGIDSVRVPTGTRNRVEIRIALRPETVIRTETYESPGFYSLRLETAAREKTERILQIGDGLVLHELDTVLSTVPVSAQWIRIDAWRDRYRLTPAFPPAGFESVAPIDEIAASSSAAAAINLGCPRAPLPVGLLIIDGTPYAVEGTSHDGLGLDLFGCWAYFSGSAAIHAKHAGGRIELDDVNRPLRYGETVAYPPGYVGTIARGVPGSFAVVKVRSNRVVSVYEGPFVSADPTATLLVASGEAKARLSLVHLGDSLSLECRIGPEGSTFANAFSAGPILVDSGVVAAAADSAGPDGGAATWSVLATDWHGGLVMLSFARESGGSAEIVEDLIALLRTMPVPVRDAIVLSRCNESALAVRDRATVFRLGSGGPYGLALCLIPLSP